MPDKVVLTTILPKIRKSNSEQYRVGYNDGVSACYQGHTTVNEQRQRVYQEQLNRELINFSLEKTDYSAGFVKGWYEEVKNYD